ncbi:hypothetical protein CFOL_v3_10812, partial [Cephalotus follicularis]
KKGKGSMLNYNEKFHPEHRCNNRMSLLLHEGRDEENDEVSEEMNDNTEGLYYKKNEPATALYALLGQDFPKTLRVTWMIMKQSISVLIDGGSTHNFIHNKVARFVTPQTQKGFEMSPKSI